MWPRAWTKGWTAIDAPSDAPVWCAASVHTATRGARPSVRAVAELANPGPDQEIAGLRELLRRTVRASFPVVATLARSQYRALVMAEPSVPDREMATSLRWSASADGEAGSPDDMNLAWMRIPTAAVLPGRPRQLYAFTTSRVWQDAQLAMWRQAGLRPKVLDVRETALRNLAVLLERGDEAGVLVGADGAGVAIVVTWRGALHLDRYAEMPLATWRSLDADARARHVDRLAGLLARTLAHLARHHPFMTVARIVVAPAPDGVDLVEPLAARVSLPVEPLALERLFDLAAVPDLARSPALQSRALVPLGATLRGLRAGAHAA